MALKGLTAIAKGLLHHLIQQLIQQSSLLNSKYRSNGTLIWIWVFFAQRLTVTLLRVDLLGIFACKDTTCSPKKLQTLH